MNYTELFSEHGLSIDRLKSFLDVVDAGSIVKAAGGDTNRQSQYSRQIKELETFFGAKLTRRKGRRIEITEEGERLARLIRESFTNLSDFLFIPKKLANEHKAKRKPRSTTGWQTLLSELPQARIVEGGRLRRVVDEAHQALAIHPNITAESTSLLQLAAMVKAGHCATILPQTATSAFQKDEVVVIPLAGFLSYQRELQVVYQTSNLKRRGWSTKQVTTLANNLRRILK